MLLEAGANIKDIQDRLGHAKLSTTMDIYFIISLTCHLLLKLLH